MSSFRSSFPQGEGEDLNELEFEQAPGGLIIIRHFVSGELFQETMAQIESFARMVDEYRAY